MNDTLNTIGKRFSCRNFTRKAVSDNDLRLIVDAAVKSPSGMNRQHWQIIIVKNVKLLSEMEAEGMRVMSELEDKTLFERIKSRGGKLFYNAPCIVFIAVKKAFQHGAELIDLGIVAQNIALAATSLGIDNCHCGLAAFCFAGEKSDEFKKRLKFPENYECGLAVLLGYAKEQGNPHVPDESKITFIE